jgi:ClpP class serine protease
MAKSIYDRFLNKVGQSRNMTYDEVRAIARGRVWTGEDALRHNLIDTLGGIQDALNIVKNRLGIPLDKRVIVRTFPEPEDEMKMLLRLFGLSDEQEELRTKTNFFSALGFNKNQYDAFYQVMPDALKPHIKHAYNLYKMSEKENILVTMPYLLDIK